MSFIKRDPHLILIAGPNGSGKSTIFPAVQSVDRDGFFNAPVKIKDDNFIDPDKIAVKYNLNEFAAGRKTIKKIKLLIELGEDIAIETTFSGKTLEKYINTARESGYKIYIIFLVLRSAELSMVRVTQRALLGKHYISLERISNRYIKSLNNFFKIYKDYADFWVIVDNSTLNVNVLYWGGHLFFKPNTVFCSTKEKNYITKFIDIDQRSNIDDFSPLFFERVKSLVAKEIKNRPKGNYVSIQEEFGKVKFVKV